MSDSVEYAKLTEIPVSSYEITVKPAKSGKDVKKRVIEKVNGQLDKEVVKKKKFDFSFVKSFFKRDKTAKEGKAKKIKVDKEKVANKEKSGSFDIITAQLITVFALVIAILITNIFWEDSAMNKMFKNVFGATHHTKELEYDNFSAVLPTDKAVSLDNGVMTFSGAGAVYTPVGGTVYFVNKAENGLYDLTVKHTSTFKTVISGLSECYYEKGYTVYSTLPIGYASGGIVSVQMFNGSNLITDYQIQNGAIVWN